MNITFINKKPALLAVSGSERWIVVSDIHIGFNVLSGLRHVNTVDEAALFGNRIIDIGEEYQSKRLLILGDLKHSIGLPTLYEKDQLGLFFKILRKKFLIWIILGNHDAGVKDFASNGIFVAGKEGIMLDDVLFCHGHSVPNNYMNSEKIIMGHIHPHALIKNKLVPVWIRYTSKCNVKPFQIIIMPHFNDDLTRENYMPGDPQMISPLLNQLDIEKYECEKIDLSGMII